MIFKWKRKFFWQCTHTINENMSYSMYNNAISLFIVSLFYELVNIKMCPTFCSHSIYVCLSDSMRLTSIWRYFYLSNFNTVKLVYFNADCEIAFFYNTKYVLDDHFILVTVMTILLLRYMFNWSQIIFDLRLFY